MTGWKCAVRRPHQHRRQHQNEAAGGSVHEFNHGGESRRHGYDVAVAEGPVGAATCAGSGGAHHGAPHDDRDAVDQNGPGQPFKRAR